MALHMASGLAIQSRVRPALNQLVSVLRLVAGAGVLAACLDLEANGFFVDLATAWDRYSEAGLYHWVGEEDCRRRYRAQLAPGGEWDRGTGVGGADRREGEWLPLLLRRQGRGRPLARRHRAADPQARRHESRLRTIYDKSLRTGTQPVSPWNGFGATLSPRSP